MPYYTYIIKSKIADKYYIGETDNLERRIILHNEGNSIFTKEYIPWEVVYFEKFDTNSDTLKREKHLKKMKSKKYIEWLISSNSEVVPIKSGSFVGSLPAAGRPKQQKPYRFNLDGFLVYAIYTQLFIRYASGITGSTSFFNFSNDSCQPR